MSHRDFGEAARRMAEVPLWYRSLVFAGCLCLALATYWLGWAVAHV